MHKNQRHPKRCSSASAITIPLRRVWRRLAQSSCTTLLPIDILAGLESCLERYMHNTELLVIGAGPYGLSVAAHAKDSGTDVTVVGESMAFWKQNMPDGMLLRSGPDWH